MGLFAALVILAAWFIPVDETPLRQVHVSIPLSFEANRGQTDPSVRCLSRGRGSTLFLTPSEAVLVLRAPARGKGLEARGGDAPSNLGSLSPIAYRPSPAALAVLRMRFVGANPAPSVEGLDELAGKSHYFLGNDPRRWRTHVPHYARVAYRSLYPGIDLVYHETRGQLEY